MTDPLCICEVLYITLFFLPGLVSYLNTACTRFEKWSYLRPKFPISTAQILLEKIAFDSSILIHKWIPRNLNITSSNFSKWKVKNIPFSPSFPATHGIFSALGFICLFICSFIHSFFPPTQQVIRKLLYPTQMTLERRTARRRTWCFMTVLI